jgi:hypothetical protein
MSTDVTRTRENSIVRTLAICCTSFHQKLIRQAQTHRKCQDVGLEMSRSRDVGFIGPIAHSNSAELLTSAFVLCLQTKTSAKEGFCLSDKDVSCCKVACCLSTFKADGAHRLPENVNKMDIHARVLWLLKVTTTRSNSFRALQLESLVAVQKPNPRSPRSGPPMSLYLQIEVCSKFKCPSVLLLDAQMHATSMHETSKVGLPRCSMWSHNVPIFWER